MPSMMREQRLQELLVEPDERLDCEIKSWLDLSDESDRAILAKALLALANHGGGFVVIGLRRGSDGKYSEAPGRPTALGAYSTDAVNGIVERYADPTFHCRLSIVSDGEKPFPVIVVPGEHRVPIRSKRSGPDCRHVVENQYYVRRPGPASDTPRAAREWDGLIRRCILATRAELFADIQNALQGRSGSTPSSFVDLRAWRCDSEERFARLRIENPEEPSRYRWGCWIFAYELVDSAEASVPLTRVKEALVAAEGAETGWPAWWVPSKPRIEPYIVNRCVECWLGDPSDTTSHFSDSAHSDFWRASQELRFFLLRGFQEDEGPDALGEPGRFLDATCPMWRIGECLLHTRRVADQFGASTVRVCASWRGIQGRSLVSRRRGFAPRGIASREDVVESELEVDVNEIEFATPRLVSEITRPLYECFGFESPDTAVFEAEIEELRKSARRFARAR